MLDAPSAVKPRSAKSFAPVSDPAALGLSVDQDSYEMQDTIGVIISYVKPQTDPTIILQISRIDEESEDGTILEDVGDPIRVTFEGTSVEYFNFAIEVDLEPGIYELRTGSVRDDPERTMFVISQ